MAFNDLREFLAVLKETNKLKVIDAEVEKDWEIAAVTRRVFQKFDPVQRPALLFNNVKGYSVPVAIGVLGASREIYALALQVEEGQILDKWLQAKQCPVEPELVDDGPCQESISVGEKVNLFELPIPVWTRGHDPGPYITAGCVISKDPETGVRNVGTYRLQLKGPDKMGLFIAPGHHMLPHIAKNEKEGRPTPVAVALGPEPAVSLCSVASLPPGVDELTIAGGLSNRPVKLVKCKTIDLEVPATAEIVIEGEVLPEIREAEGPFGEYTGYVGPVGNNFLVRVNCVTNRSNPIYQAFFSEMPPSESSCIRGIGHEASLYQHLKLNLGLPVTDVHLKEGGGSGAYLVIAMRKDNATQPKQAVLGAWSYNPELAKIAVVVDEDIDPRNPFAVDWALSFRMRPYEDVFIENNLTAVILDPSVAAPGIPQHEKNKILSSKMGMDATMKHPYPPVSLPPIEDLKKVDQRWKDYGF